MLDNMLSAFKKRVRMLTLMSGVVAAPLVHAENKTFSEIDAVIKNLDVHQKEEKNDDESTKVDSLLHQVNTELDEHSSFGKGVCRASAKEVEDFLLEIENMSDTTEENVSSVSTNCVTQKTNNTVLSVESTLPLPATNAVEKVQAEETTPATNVVETVQAEEKIPTTNVVEVVQVEETTPATNVVETVQAEEKVPVINVIERVQDKEKMPVMDVAKTFQTQDESVLTQNQSLPEESESHQSKALWFTLLVVMGCGTLYLVKEFMQALESKKKSINMRGKYDEVFEPFVVEKEKPRKIVLQKTNAPRKEKTVRAPIKEIPLDWNELSKDKSEVELYQQGVRKLGVIKIQRAALRQQKKALMAELMTANEERKIQIEALLDKIADHGRELSQERRQACVLIRGEQGEKDRKQRRLYAKQMAQLRRLTKKDGLDRSVEIDEINKARSVMKEAYKKAIADAQRKADDRSQQAGYKHGIRLLHEVEAEQKELDSFFHAVKKKTGLKRKKDILISDKSLFDRQQETTQKKRQALKLIKGRKFTREKNELGKQLKAALVEHDILAAERISDQVKNVQKEQKEYIKKAQDFNYGEGRIDLINPTTAQRIRKHREAVRIKRERLKKAHRLRGQRMLYYLYNNQSSAVNNNQMTNGTYYQEAMKLLGDSAKTIHVSDYPKQRCDHLKDATLAGIYRRRRQMERQ